MNKVEFAKKWVGVRVSGVRDADEEYFGGARYKIIDEGFTGVVQDVKQVSSDGKRALLGIRIDHGGWTSEWSDVLIVLSAKVVMGSNLGQKQVAANVAVAKRKVVIRKPSWIK